MNNRVTDGLLIDLIEVEPTANDDRSLGLLVDGNSDDTAFDEGNTFVAGLAENGPPANIAADLSSNEDAMVLSLEDLFPDENGEVVITTEDGLPINLIASLPVDQSGVADAHVTAAGIDVSGLSFHTFESGLTIYFEADSLVQITDAAGDG